MTRRHLVTGAAGFIGSNLVARLKNRGESVVGIDIKETFERKHLYQRADEFWLYDLRSPALCYSAIQGFDRIWHLAADHGGAGYFHGPADFKAADNNLAIDRNVRRAAQKIGARLFFAGSACGYPVSIQGRGARALRESDWGGGPAEASYGEAKRMSTIMFEAAREHGHDFRTGIFSTIYGPTQDTEEPRAKFPTAICRKILEDPERVEVWGDGTQVRTFLYIEDALDRIQTVMHDLYLGPVNVGSDEEVTVQECCEWAAKALGVTPEWVYNLDAPTGVPHRSADNSEWNRRYGEGNLTPASEGFQRLAKWMAHEKGHKDVV